MNQRRLPSPITINLHESVTYFLSSSWKELADYKDVIVDTFSNTNFMEWYFTSQYQRRIVLMKYSLRNVTPVPETLGLWKKVPNFVLLKSWISQYRLLLYFRSNILFLLPWGNRLFCLFSFRINYFLNFYPLDSRYGPLGGRSARYKATVYTGQHKWSGIQAHFRGRRHHVPYTEPPFWSPVTYLNKKSVLLVIF
jgi:hypothetical protein